MSPSKQFATYQNVRFGLHHENVPVVHPAELFENNSVQVDRTSHRWNRYAYQGIVDPTPQALEEYHQMRQRIDRWNPDDRTIEWFGRREPYDQYELRIREVEHKASLATLQTPGIYGSNPQELLALLDSVHSDAELFELFSRRVSLQFVCKTMGYVYYQLHKASIVCADLERRFKNEEALRIRLGATGSIDGATRSLADDNQRCHQMIGSLMEQRDLLIAEQRDTLREFNLALQQKEAAWDETHKAQEEARRLAEEKKALERRLHRLEIENQLYRSTDNEMEALYQEYRSIAELVTGQEFLSEDSTPQSSQETKVEIKEEPISPTLGDCGHKDDQGKYPTHPDGQGNYYLSETGHYIYNAPHVQRPKLTLQTQNLSHARVMHTDSFSSLLNYRV